MHSKWLFKSLCTSADQPTSHCLQLQSPLCPQPCTATSQLWARHSRAGLVFHTTMWTCLKRALKQARINSTHHIQSLKWKMSKFHVTLLTLLCWSSQQKSSPYARPTGAAQLQPQGTSHWPLRLYELQAGSRRQENFHSSDVSRAGRPAGSRAYRAQLRAQGLSKGRRGPRQSRAAGTPPSPTRSPGPRAAPAGSPLPPMMVRMREACPGQSTNVNCSSPGPGPSCGGSAVRRQEKPRSSVMPRARLCGARSKAAVEPVVLSARARAVLPLSMWPNTPTFTLRTRGGAEPAAMAALHPGGPSAQRPCGNARPAAAVPRCPGPSL